MAQAGAGFSAEQQQYLIGVLSDLKLHRAFQGAGASSATPEPETVYGTPLEDLCKEELAKHERHPLDMWRQLEQWEAEGHLAAGLDQFLLRHLGFFNVEPNSPGYMMRLRCPGCSLRGEQMALLGDLAEDHAGGYAHVTTRGSLQLREIQPGNVIPMIEKMQALGLTSQGTRRGFRPQPDLRAHRRGRSAGAHRHPPDGQPPEPAHPAQPRAAGHPAQVQHLLRRRRHDLLRLRHQRHLLSGGRAARKRRRHRAGDLVPHRAWRHHRAQGFRPRYRLACRPEQAVDVAEAMLRVFVQHGNRGNRGKARLKYLLDGKGAEWFCAETQTMLESFGTGVTLAALPEGLETPRATIDRSAHIGVQRQRQDGLNYVGIALEMGRLSAEQMRGLGRIAAAFGSNDIRLTVWQNPLILGVRDADIATVEAELAALGLPTRASSFATGAVACTGRWGCKLGLAHTKQDALRIVRHLESRFTLDQPINIHLTGCPNSCAQHYIGDIGLVGTTLGDGREGYHVVIGGGIDQDQGLARPLVGPVAADEITALIEHVVGHYLAKRAPGQSFLAYTRSLDDAALRALLPSDLADAA